MADQRKKKLRARAIHQAFVRKTLAELQKSGKNIDKEERIRIVDLKFTLEEQYEAIIALNRDISDLLSDKEVVNEEEVVAEIEEADKLRADIKTATITLEETLKHK